MSTDEIEEKLLEKEYFSTPKLHENGLRRKKPSGKCSKRFCLFVFFFNELNSVQVHL